MSNQPDRFLSRNTLASRMAMLVFPLSELLALAGILPVVLPVGQVIALAVISMLAMLLDLRTAPRDGRSWRLVCLVWLAGAALALAWLGVKAVGAGQVFYEFQLLLLPVLAFILLFRMLVKKSWVYAKIFSCLAAIGCLFIGAIMAWSVLDAAVKFLPIVYDPVLYQIDGILGLRVFYRLADLLNAAPQFRSAIIVFYEYNLVFALPVIFSEAFYTRKAAVELTVQLLISSFLVFPLFCVMPALAPGFFFGTAFPDHLPSTLTPLPVLGQVQSIRNTFPSLHATWAILICLALVDSPLWQRALGILYLLITFLATIGFGEHYVVDWIGAVPLVLLVRGLCAAGLAPWAPARLSAVAVGGIFLASWVVIARTAPASLNFPWALRGFAVICVVIPYGFERWMRNAERAGVPACA